MSMNLCFYTKTKTPRHIQFPFQTPTTWTFEIYRASDAKTRCDILKAKMKDNPWLTADLIEECESMLMDDDLELSYI